MRQRQRPESVPQSINPTHRSIPIAELTRSAPRRPQIEPYAGEFERRRPASQRGVWGSVPPDLGFAPTSKTRNPPIYTACHFALDMSNPDLTLFTNNQLPNQLRKLLLTDVIYFATKITSSLSTLVCRDHILKLFCAQKLECA
jgi:hypothetical protein